MRNLLNLTAAVFFFASHSALAQSEPPIVEWEQRMNAEERLRSYGPDILGDGIDPHTGAITFEHTDVSLPGNSSLEVSVRRKRSQGYLYKEGVDVEFGDWELIVPRIKVVRATQYPWAGTRCSDSFSNNFPNVSNGQGQGLTQRHEYSGGVMVDVPGAGSQQILELPSGAQWPANASHVTTDNWYLTCGVTANDGGEGFYAYSPNGNRYRFDRLIEHAAKPLGYFSNGNNRKGRTKSMLAATEVTDVNGNWVRYDYDSLGRLTKIHSNDGRRIDFFYTISGMPELISKITANPGTADARSWHYAYAASTFIKPSWELEGLLNNQSLDRVTLPDNQKWYFDIDGMQAEPGPGTNCLNGSRTLTVTHPYGMTGVFRISERKHRLSQNGTVPRSLACPDVEYTPSEPLPVYQTATTETMAVTKKELSGPNVPLATWTYTYEQDPGTVAGDGYNWTRVTDPTGGYITYWHYYNDHAYGGKLRRKDVRQSSFSGPLLDKTDHIYLQEGVVGQTFASIGLVPRTIRQPARMKDTTITRGADWYKTRNTYDTDFSSTTYSFGSPTRVDMWSNTSGDWNWRRYTDIIYEHNKTKWVLGLTKQVSKRKDLFSTRVVEDHGYDALGRRLWTDMYGYRAITLTYNNDGTLNTYKDALNRLTTLQNYKRGLAQQLIRPDSISLHRTVDNNGWIKSVTNGRGYTTNFNYNNVGWLTLIDRPENWSDTTIDYYDLGSADFRQIAIRGPVQTTNWYDSMLRARLTRQNPLTGGGVVSYVKTTHDIFGRETFASLPTTSNNPTIGTDTTYDALGRVTLVRENQTPYAQTTTEYLSDNRVRATNPAGHATTVTRNSYGHPEDGPTVLIEQPEGVGTLMAFDLLGNMTSATQAGNYGGYNVTSTQNYYYDDRMRLCRHSVPETGDTLFEYDNAGQNVGVARGQPTGGDCASLPSADKIAHTYDSLGRIDFVNYPGSTPDIDFAYDANGNVTQNARGGANWTYQYNSADLPTEEKLVIDGRTYATGWYYNDEGLLNGQATPSGRLMLWAKNGLGQVTDFGTNFTALHVTNMTYHVNGDIKSANYENGYELSTVLNARQLRQQTQVYKPGVPVSAINFTYEYDAMGRVDSFWDWHLGLSSGKLYDFSYDGVGRLKTANGPWGAGSFKYDALGNIREKKLANRVVDLHYDGQNRLAWAGDSDAFSGHRWFHYDARGNVINNGTNKGRHEFVYDRAEQPITVKNSGGATIGTYVYDGNLKRVKQVVDGKTIYSIYSLAGAILYRDNVTDNELTEYASLNGKTIARFTGAEITFPHQDHLGSPVAATDAAGNVLWREEYTPFGEKRLDPAANRDDEGFTGHIDDDATGLTYMQARYYDPVIGRFLSNDPVEFAPDQPQMFNRYSYVHNDPVNNTDPDGRICVPCIGAAVGFVAEAVSIGVDVANGRDVSLGEGAARLGASTALGAVGGGAAGQLAKGVAQVAARSTASAATKATASVATKTAGNAAVGGAVNGSNTAARREIQVGLTGSSDITNSDIRGDIALGAAGAAGGTLVGEGVEAVARLAGPTDDVGRVGAAGAQALDAIVNVGAVNPGAFEGDQQPCSDPEKC